ncbi:MAG TPA: endonuclease III [Candidatus Marinimicrobia bacterium]|nr:endonuclease III [Candidatus Neomarinimicrobiota bacterium]HIB03104.1 endonuclease III [Candidatus Neomarinimicrobiota bacterium]HIB70774.1 endonuclease III [Candidatus Neomarinimicrobiota bacterium]HIB96793.1 endonuclease III [Candidatus Neomarinimicrobiota bacterium]HIN61146.1 endonuclease III [Candidatus Neomarinimicrobiota bacterium]
MKESQQSKRERMVQVIDRLKKEYPSAKCSLDYRDAHQLLVSTILSAQCTDKRVNMVTPGLFKKYKTVAAFAYCDVNELSEDIRSTGYHNQKAKSIQGTSLMIQEEYEGEVPSTMEDLLQLPGVGRKTANCVLGTVFNVPSMVIDTHMVRIMNLLGFTQKKNPVNIEFEIVDIAEEKNWVILTHLIIEHGRNVCIARRPQCSDCCLSDICPSSLV